MPVIPVETTVAAGEEVERLILDGLDLSPGIGLYALESLTLTPPRKRKEWATGADADGADLVRDPLFENREITAQIRVLGDSMDESLEAIGAISDKIEEAERQPDGLPLVWTPANATAGLTFYVLSGDIDELPITVETGWWVNWPLVTVRFDAKPFGYAEDEVVVPARMNYVPNPTFEFGTEQWGQKVAGTGGTLSRVTTEHHSGAASGREVTNGSGASEGIATSYISLAPSTTYIASAWVKGAVGAALKLRFSELDSAGTSVGDATSNFTATGDWERVSASRAFGATGVGAKVRVETQATLSTTFYVDDVMLNEGSTLYDFDGSVYGYGTPLLSLSVPDVPGDVPAEARLKITERAGQARRHVDWGLEQRYHDALAPLLIDSGDMVTSDYAGSTAFLTGAWDPDATGNNSVLVAALAAPQTICAIPAQPHVGTYRVKARVRTQSTDVRFRLVWRVGGAGARGNAWSGPPVEFNFAEIDLGLISIPPTTLGAQSWSGEIEVYRELGQTTQLSSTTSLSAWLDYLVLIPVESSGKARSPFRPRPATKFVYDNFATAVDGANLLGRAPAVGPGTWGEFGATGNFTTNDGYVERAVSSESNTEPKGRFATEGSLVTTYQRVLALVYFTGRFHEDNNIGLIARWTDISNYLRLAFRVSSATTTQLSGRLVLEKRVAGTTSEIRSKDIVGTKQIVTKRWYGMSLTVEATGRISAMIYAGNNPNVPLASLIVTDTALATGGALAAGRSGIWDHNPGTDLSARRFDNFQIETTPITDASEPTLNPDRSIEVRHDETIREDADGVTWSRPPNYTGARLLVPPAGDANRISRIAVKAHREDVDTGDAETVTDPISAELTLTPRYLVVPRQ